MMKKIGLAIFKKSAKSRDWLPAPKITLLLAGLLAAHSIAFCQTLPSLLTGKTSAPANQAPVDPLGRSTPRSAILSFLQACDSGRFILAARYLDLSKIPNNERAKQGPDLARQLADILDRDPRFEVDLLSDSPGGNLTDGLAPDHDLLVKLETSDTPAVLELQRIQEDGLSVWLVSSDSVPRIPDVDALESSSVLEKRMPKILVRHRIFGTPLWVWIGLIALTLVLFALSRLLSFLFLAILAPVAKRFASSLQSYRLESLTDPLRLLISVAVFRALMEVITPSALVRDYLIKLLVLLSTVGFAALAMRVVDLASSQVQNYLGPTQRALSYSVLPLGVRVIRICIFLLAALVILASFGYNTNALLAGLGVGGLAVALAAQKTIENLFGGIALISDRPVLVGDYCQFGTQTGTVEDIGLRSTRIRTNQRTMVSIPNSNFSTMTIENFSRRDRIFFHPVLRLRRDTAPEKVREMMNAATAILTDHPLVQTS